MNLLDLPSEILLAVCRQLCRHCVFGSLDLDPDYGCDAKAEARRSLSALSRTCTRLRDCAQPVLFHSPDPNEDDVANFIRTLHRHRHLAHEVVHLHILLASPFANRGISSQDFDFFSQLIAKHSGRGTAVAATPGSDEDPDGAPPHQLGQQIGWLFQHSPAAGLAALILTQVPNLVRLQVRTLFHVKFPFVQQGSLSSLTDLSIEHNQERFDINSLGDILAAAPALTALTCSGICGHLEQPFPSCGLTQLSLVKSSITKDSLVDLLDACYNLQSFTHENTGYDSTQQPTPYDISLALIQRADSLRHLRIYRRYVFSRDGVPDGARSFKKMKLLRELEIHSTALWSIRGTDPSLDGNRLVKLLPSAIETFTLTDPHEAFLPDLVRLAEYAPVRFPKLRKVRFGIMEEKVWEVVGAAFKAQGIGCKARQVIPSAVSDES